MLKLIHALEGLRYFRISLKRKLFGAKKYTGNPEQICQRIIDDCWNGEYFMASAGHYREFWARDFGFSVDSLLKLGYRKEVLKTVEYALSKYKNHGSITTAISPAGACFSFPDYYSLDSVALFFYSLKQAKANKLIKKYRSFLNKEIKRFYNVVLDKNTGLVKRDKRFSSARDYAIRDSSCYDNVMLGLMAETVKYLKLDNPFKKFDFKKALIKNFWNGSYFIDSLADKKIITGDANLAPFLLIKDTKLMKKAFAAIQKHGLDSPFPLKYQTKGKKSMILAEFLVQDWEYNCIWSQFGLLYLHLLKMVNKKRAKTLTNKYREQLEKHKTGYEVFTPKGKPYKSVFYMADEGMLWYANFLTLK